MRLLPPIDAPEFKSNGDRDTTPLAGHTHSALSRGDTGIRTGPPLPRLPGSGFLCRGLIGLGGGCFCFSEGSVTLRGGIAGEAFLSPRDEPGKL